jgi:hypothetical protein
MEKTGRIATILTLAIIFCFGIASIAQAGPSDPVTQGWANKNLENKNKAVSIPIWKITKDGTATSVKWVDYAPNPRFAIYDSGTPEDIEDDIVLDKETGLVWERSPFGSGQMKWTDAIYYCYSKDVGGRLGWRLPTVEELASLVDRTQSYPSLPSGHPFDTDCTTGGCVGSNIYWSATTSAYDTSLAWYIYMGYGNVYYYYKTCDYYVWCVRGGQGYDAY